MRNFFLVCFVFCDLLLGQLTTTTAVDAAGKVAISYKNVSGSPLTALVITWMSMPGRGVGIIYRDALVQDNFPPSDRGQENTVTVGGGSPVVQAQIRAAVLDDGTIFGDPDWVQMILKRRQHYLEGLNDVLSDLERIASHRDIAPSAMVPELTQSENFKLAAVPVSTYALKELFSEPTQAIKDANLQAIAADDWRSCIRVAHSPVLMNLAKPSPRPNILSVFVERCTLKAQRLASSRREKRLTSLYSQWYQNVFFASQFRSKVGHLGTFPFNDLLGRRTRAG